MAAPVATAAASAAPAPSTALAARASTTPSASAVTTTGTAAAAPGKRKLNIFYTPVHDRNIGSVKLLVATVLPVGYSDEFYRAIMTMPADLTRMAYYDDIFVGCICCRLEPGAEAGTKRLYVAVIAVLAPYRGRGIGTAMLQAVMDAVPSHPDVREVYLHVHTANEDAQTFYTKAGFERGELLSGYYRGIDPPDAYIYRKRVNAPAAGSSKA